MSNIGTYSLYLDGLISSNDGQVFDNPSSEHAAIVLNKMLIHTKEVYAYFKDLDGSITENENCATEVEKFIENNNQLHILIDYDSKHDSEIYKILKKSQHRKNLVVKKAHDEFKLEMSEDLGLRYFVVAGNKMYRNQTESIEHIATCSFNDPDQAQIFKDIFLSYWDISPAFQFQ